MKRLDFLKRLLVIPAIPLIVKDAQAEKKRLDIDRAQFYKEMIKHGHSSSATSCCTYIEFK